MTHICVSKLTKISADNGLSPDRRQANIWTNAGILLIGPFGTNVSEILIQIYTFSFKKMRLKMSSGKWRLFCLGLNVFSGTQKMSINAFISSPVLARVLARNLDYDLIYQKPGYPLSFVYCLGIRLRAFHVMFYEKSYCKNEENICIISQRWERYVYAYDVHTKDVDGQIIHFHLTKLIHYLQAWNIFGYIINIVLSEKKIGWWHNKSKH